MGVLKFFRHIALKYNDCLVPLRGSYTSCETAQSKGIHIDWLELDLNSIFHPVAQELFGYTKQEPKQVSLLNPRRNRPSKETPKNISDEEIFQAICERIYNIITICGPTKGIYFATDGVAGVSKQTQQRKRRFKSASANVAHSGFDSNNLSCGTVFMDKLGDYIERYIREKKKAEWKDMSIIVNNARIVGEGEHKLLKHMRDNPQWSYCVVSPDADLIFLTMGLHNPNVHIFRENIFDDIMANYFLVNVHKFRQSLLNFIQIDVKDNNAVEDFIFFTFFIGNDFLPNITSLDISNDGIETLLRVYETTIKNKGYLVSKTVGQLNINKESFKYLLQTLGSVEKDTIFNNHRKYPARFPDTNLVANISYEFKEGVRVGNFDFDKYKNRYYQEKFDGVSIRDICHEYFKGMIFVLRYYLDNIPSYDWCYPFLYAPFFTEMADHIDDFDTSMKFNPSTPLTPLEQLISILPSKSAYILPEPLRVLSSPESPIADMYPIDYETDLEGKKYDYEGIVIIPIVDVKRLRSAFDKLKDELETYDKERNSPGEIKIY
jgi:5'-3' exonuclease